MNSSFSPVRLWALMRKESLQILRDPSTLLIAVVLPIIILFLFAYAVSLDLRHVKIGLVINTDNASAQTLRARFYGTPYFSVRCAHSLRTLRPLLKAGQLRGIVVIPSDFAQRLNHPQQGVIQIITDGSQPNTANFVATYAQNVYARWLEDRQHSHSTELVPRFWFNPDVDSRQFLIPGALAIVMTIIGTLLTALVVAREWERGSMEALMSTPVSVPEILLGKLLPYFFLGLIAMSIATALAIVLFQVPFRGSTIALFLLTCSFLIPALGQGLFISILSKNQFIAAQYALISGYLPAFMLSGFLYSIPSMPWPVRLITHIVPARYFVSSLQTVFLVGDVWPLFIPNILSLLLIGLVFFTLARLNLHKSLEN